MHFCFLQKREVLSGISNGYITTTSSISHAAGTDVHFFDSGIMSASMHTKDILINYIVPYMQRRREPQNNGGERVANFENLPTTIGVRIRRVHCEW